MHPYKNNEDLHMRQHLSVITLAVKDLDAAFKFYHHGLGLKSQGMIGTEFEYGAVAFFDLQQGLKLALCTEQLES